MGIFSKLFGGNREKCSAHPNKNAIGICASCKQPFCADCLSEVLDWYCCESEKCKNDFKDKINIYTPGRSLVKCPFNPFVVPPGIESNVHVNQLVDVMSLAFML